MSYRRRHRWLRRFALGLAFATFVAPAAARPDEGGAGSNVVTAGGWTGPVDPESGIPLSAGIPHGDEPYLGEQPIQVIPYLSQGILTEADKAAAAAEAIHDPYLTDVFVRPGESLGGPDGDAIAFKNALETQAAAAAEAIHDRYLTDVFVRPGESLGGPDGGLSSEELAFAPAVVASADALHDPIGGENAKVSPSVLGEMVKSQQAPQASVPANRVERALEEGPQVVNYLSHGMAADGEVGARPDNKADRFAHSDVASRTELASNGSSVSWDTVTTLGIGAVVLALALGLGMGFIKRPKLAGL